MSNVLMGLVVVEVVLTIIGLAILMWRGLLGMKEDDHLVLSKAEAHLEREQQAIRHRSDTLGKYLSKLGIAWGALLAAIIGLWFVVEFL
ncbi:MAG TPA: hypothetical protein VFY29_18650 [Terriglobia bacterium]|nr:hypothetical protein [Terriglobia bacterium]